jgi:D-methionine transport system ATP-binding protein
MISIRDVYKHFSGNPTAAVAGVSLDIAEGQIVGIIGRSGAGKSTLVRLINALEKPDSGSIIVRGLAVETLLPAGLRELRRKVGMIFQNFGLLSSRNVSDNVAFPLKLAGVPKLQRNMRVAELLERVGLSAHAAKFPAQLSGGQKQRVGIARALATRPDILLCDEATSALDPETTASVLALLRDLNRELGLTIVLITHEMDVVRSICDQVAIMEAGKIVERGTAKAIFADAKHPSTQRMLAELSA